MKMQGVVVPILEKCIAVGVELVPETPSERIFLSTFINEMLFPNLISQTFPAGSVVITKEEDRFFMHAYRIYRPV